MLPPPRTYKAKTGFWIRKAIGQAIFSGIIIGAEVYFGFKAGDFIFNDLFTMSDWGPWLHGEYWLAGILSLVAVGGFFRLLRVRKNKATVAPDGYHSAGHGFMPWNQGIRIIRKQRSQDVHNHAGGTTTTTYFDFWIVTRSGKEVLIESSCWPWDDHFAHVNAYLHAAQQGLLPRAAKAAEQAFKQGLIDESGQSTGRDDALLARIAGGGGAPPDAAAPAPSGGGRNTNCPRCKTEVFVPAGAKPNCHACGFGA